MAKHYVDRCGNCVFSRPTAIDEEKVECVMGGNVSAPMSPDHSPCICYRPSVKEMRRRGIAPVKKRLTPAERYASKTNAKKSVKWTDEMDGQLRILCLSRVDTISDIARQMGVQKKDVVNRINELGIEREPVASTTAVKAMPQEKKIVVPTSQQKYPRLKCCKGLCCKYKEQCAHYAHWIEMGKPQFDTINSVGSCINVPYRSNTGKDETLNSYREFISLDMKSREPELLTFSETC